MNITKIVFYLCDNLSWTTDHLQLHHSPETVLQRSSSSLSQFLHENSSKSQSCHSNHHCHQESWTASQFYHYFRLPIFYHQVTSWKNFVLQNLHQIFSILEANAQNELQLPVTNTILPQTIDWAFLVFRKCFDYCCFFWFSFFANLCCSVYIILTNVYISWVASNCE